MILITGAGGKTGLALIRALVARGEAVRAFVRREEQVVLVKAAGVQEALAGDMRVAELMKPAVAGVRAVYHICPNVSPDELAIGRIAIDAARDADVVHFVYHSVLHPQVEAMPHHWQKMRVEEALFESGLPYTIVQPAAYMQNILAQWAPLLERGVYTVPYPVETQLSLVDLEDAAEASANILTELGHTRAIYELAGTRALSQVEVAELLSLQLNRPVRAERQPIEDWQRKARAAWMGDYQIETLTRMFEYYEKFGLWGNPNSLSWLLRRTPTSFPEFVGRTMRERLP
jgi:NAD(P)H dehydrogenase (quinone)